jgi:hypothetical protein
MKRVVPAIIIVIALLITAIGISKPWIGGVVETCQTGERGLKLRLDRRTERCLFMCGAYYEYRYAPSGSNKWRETFTIFQDDPHPLRCNQIVVLNDHVGYVFHYSKYAVSVDGGLSWSGWEVSEKLPFERYRVYPYIEDVSIQSDGSGMMRLNHNSNERVSLPNLYTEDFGRSWSIK